MLSTKLKCNILPRWKELYRQLQITYTLLRRSTLHVAQAHCRLFGATRSLVFLPWLCFLFAEPQRSNHGWEPQELSSPECKGALIRKFKRPAWTAVSFVVFSEQFSCLFAHLSALGFETHVSPRLQAS